MFGTSASLKEMSGALFQIQNRVLRLEAAITGLETLVLELQADVRSVNARAEAALRQREDNEDENDFSGIG